LPAILPVVGLVASAASLDAYKAFPDTMPANNGMAFVLIPRLDPRHESLMAPLLVRHTDMSIKEYDLGVGRGCRWGDRSSKFIQSAQTTG
jgi:hypothetical protein